MVEALTVERMLPEKSVNFGGNGTCLFVAYIRDARREFQQATASRSDTQRYYLMTRIKNTLGQANTLHLL